MVKTGYIAVVSGATGAVGRDLVAELVGSANCAKVIALTRRDIPESKWAATFPLLNVTEAQNKLEIRPVDFDALADDLLSGDKVDASFCCLGTTRKDAGSAEAFRKVDLEYTRRIGEVSKSASIPYFGLLTAFNANKNSWFLYPKTKGEGDEAIGKLQFERTSYFRPGLINRGDLMRKVEMIGLYVVPSVTTHAIAKAMVVDYESADAAAGVKEWEMADLRKFDATK